MMNHSSLKNEDSQPGSESWHSTECKTAMSQCQGLLPGQEFSGVFPIWKRLGETLAVLLERFRGEAAVPAATKITYAGRLDPAAEGVVLLLVGDDRMKKEEFLKLPKTYLLTILFGIKTDTADLLGVPLVKKEVGQLENTENILQSFAGATTLPYPMYSSKPVAGKPLFIHARAGQKVAIPENQVFIRSIDLVEQKTVSSAEILKRVYLLTKIVVGDFRQNEIEAAWKVLLQSRKENFPLLTMQVQASSGTYMRSLAEAIGNKLNIPACAFAIVREKIGEFTVSVPE